MENQIDESRITVEELESSLRVLVPGLYSQWRTSQLEVIEQIANSKQKFIALQAPPGFGKSVSAIGSIITKGGRGLTVTQTKQLGDQYYRDFFPIGLKTVKGRNNFQCRLVPDKTADTAPCNAGLKCLWKHGGCDYYDQKKEATENSLVSMNIQYFLNEANYAGEFSGIETIFIDEAHKLDNAMMSFIEIRLSKQRFSDEGLPLPLKSLSIDSLKEWSDKAFNTIKPELDQITEALEEDPQNEILTIRGIRLQAAHNNLLRFRIVDDTWIIEQDEYSVILKPTWTGKYMEEFLFSHANKIVFMSATLPRSIIEGFNILNYEYINLPSTFDPKNRPVIWIPAANLAASAENPGQELRKLAGTTDMIIDKFPNSKGMIHTVNYKIANYLKNNLKNKHRIITHESAKEREDVLNQFKKSNTNSILLSPSFTEGVDLPYDECRFQVIAKIPYESLGNKQVKARMDVDPQWYATNAIVTMIQAYGRAMRAEDDSGATYILDASLMNLINRWKTIFDQVSYFLDALWIQQPGQPIISFQEYQHKKNN